ncbi:MAG: hypothetical protein AAFS03_09505 [Pseudomonadota bacterium]
MIKNVTIPALIAVLVIGLAPSAMAHQDNRKQAAASFVKADPNGDGLITTGEFQARAREAQR